MSSHCLLATIVCGKKSAEEVKEFYWGFLVCDESVLPCFFQDCLFVISLTMMCLGMALNSSNLNSFNGQINIFHQSWYVFGHYFLKYSLCPLFAFSFPSEISISIMYILVQLMGFHSSQKVFSFFFILFFFSVPPTRQFQSTYLHFCWLFAGSNMLLRLFNEFSISLIVLFNSRISIQFFFIFCLFIDILFFCETLCSYLPLTL